MILKKQSFKNKDFLFKYALKIVNANMIFFYNPPKEDYFTIEMFIDNSFEDLVSSFNGYTANAVQIEPIKDNKNLFEKEKINNTATFGLTNLLEVVFLDEKRKLYELKKTLTKYLLMKKLIRNFTSSGSFNYRALKETKTKIDKMIYHLDQLNGYNIVTRLKPTLVKDNYLEMNNMSIPVSPFSNSQVFYLLNKETKEIREYRITSLEYPFDKDKLGNYQANIVYKLTSLIDSFDLLLSEIDGVQGLSIYEGRFDQHTNETDLYLFTEKNEALNFL